MIGGIGGFQQQQTTQVGGGAGGGGQQITGDAKTDMHNFIQTQLSPEERQALHASHQQGGAQGGQAVGQAGGTDLASEAKSKIQNFVSTLSPEEQQQVQQLHAAHQQMQGFSGGGAPGMGVPGTTGIPGQ